MQYFADVQLPQSTMEEAVRKACANKQHLRLGHFDFPQEDFDPVVTSALRDMGMVVSHLEVFYTPASHMLPIHVDGRELSSLCKLNWVYGGVGSRMMWWKPKATTTMSLNETPVRTPYLFLDQKSCTMITSKKIGQPTLVNVGQPHSVMNPGKTERFCLSAVLADAHTRINLEFDEVLNRFLAAKRQDQQVVSA